MILYSQVFIVRPLPRCRMDQFGVYQNVCTRTRRQECRLRSTSALHVESRHSCLLLSTPLHRLARIVRDHAVAAGVAQARPVALAIRRPWDDADAVRVQLVDQLAIDVAEL